MKPVKVCCPTCKGSGEIEAAGVYIDTLHLLRRQKGEVSGADLARIDGCNPTAMCNRLAALERMGLAVSRRYGRRRLFKAT